MRVLYHIPYPDGLGADRWICEGWQEGFRALGHDFHLLTAEGRLTDWTGDRRPDLFFTAINLIDPDREREALDAMRARGTKVLLWVHWPLESRIDPRRGEALRRDDVADLYFGEREPEEMARFEQETGKRYHVIPHAANPALHFPVAPVPLYRYDVVYLGAKLRKKRWFAREILRPLARRCRVGVFGPGWTLRDQGLRAASRLSRRLGTFGVARGIDRARITVPADAERALYSSAAIALNFHEREDDGSQPHYIVNQRTFKIPACGGFEICDEVPAVRKYFGEDELITAAVDAGDWMAKVDHFLRHPDERERIRARGIERARRDHLSTHRVASLLTLLGCA